MKPDSLFSRYTILWTVILCYLLPILVLLTHKTVFENTLSDWHILTINLVLAFIASCAIFFIMARWESMWHLQIKQQKDLHLTQLPPSSLPQSLGNMEISLAMEEVHQMNRDLQAEIEKLMEKARQLSIESDHHQQQSIKTSTELESYRKTACIQLEQHQIHIHRLQEMIAEQKILLEKKHQQVGSLESKVGDLTYEIKTLLQLAETHAGSLVDHTLNLPPPSPLTLKTDSILAEDPPPSTEKHTSSLAEASQQLKRCLDIAQKITGSHRFNNQSNQLFSSTADTFALDLRRLCDSLRSENNSLILLYSPKENHLLFANNQIKALTGWSPEKFVQNFNELLQEETIWKQGIANLATKSEVHIKFPLKTRTGQSILFQALLGNIPTGIFRYHVIAILYLSKQHEANKSMPF